MQPSSSSSSGSGPDNRFEYERPYATEQEPQRAWGGGNAASSSINGSSPRPPLQFDAEEYLYNSQSSASSAETASFLEQQPLPPFQEGFQQVAQEVGGQASKGWGTQARGNRSEIFDVPDDDWE